MSFTGVLTVHLSLVWQDNFPPSARRVDGQGLLETLLDFGGPDAFCVGSLDLFVILEVNENVVIVLGMRIYIYLRRSNLLILLDMYIILGTEGKRVYTCVTKNFLMRTLQTEANLILETW
jgi:hypothetical protein